MTADRPDVGRSDLPGAADAGAQLDVGRGAGARDGPGTRDGLGIEAAEGAGFSSRPAGPVHAPTLCVLPGTPQAAGTARQIALQLLGAAHPAADTVMLLISELVTNAIVHSRSGVSGGTLTLALCPGAAGVLIQVSDAGGPSAPYLSAVLPDGAEHGYGLLLVDALADSWGTLSSPEGRVTWCRVGSGGRGQP
jgi:anti-sigma regulatory factor (Ser/Thr protein kinase)